MLKGVANTELARFSLKGDTENPTVFLIRNIPIAKKAELFGDIGKADQKSQMLASIDLFVAGVARIENLNGDTVTEITAEVFNRFFQPEQEQIINAISEYNRLGKIEIKN